MPIRVIFLLLSRNQVGGKKKWAVVIALHAAVIMLFEKSIFSGRHASLLIGDSLDVILDSLGFKWKDINHSRAKSKPSVALMTI